MTECVCNDWQKAEVGCDCGYEQAWSLLFEAGKECKFEGGDLENAHALFDVMLMYADREYVESAELMGDDAIECFIRGLS